MKTKDGNLWWKVQGREFKQPVTIPPDKSLMVFPNGKIGAEGKICSDGNIEWLQPVNTSETLYKDPLDTADRQIMATEFAKANDRNKKSWWQEHGAGAVTLGALVMLILGCLIFGGDFYRDVMKPAEIMTKNLEEAVDKQTQHAEILKEIKSEIQYLKVQKPKQIEELDPITEEEEET